MSAALLIAAWWGVLIILWAHPHWFARKNNDNKPYDWKEEHVYAWWEDIR